MRELVIAAVALVLGLLLGGVIPRGEAREAERELAALRERPCDGGRLGSELSAAFAGRPALGPGVRDDPAPEGSVVVVRSQRRADDAEDTEAPPVRDDAEEPTRRDPESAQAMREALELRRTQARAALVEGADPTGPQLDEIDQAVTDMNDELRHVAEDFVARISEGDEPSRRELMGFAADTLDIVIAAEDRMSESLTSNQRDALAEGALDPFSYVDPALLDILEHLDR